MTCRKCKHEFCWGCRQKYHDHSDSICILHHVIRYLIYSIMLMGILHKLGFMEIIIWFVFKILRWILGDFIYYNLIIFYAFAIFNNIKAYRYHALEHSRAAGYYTIFWILITIVHMYLMYIFSHITCWINFLLMETVGLAVLSGVVFPFIYLNEKLLQYLV